MSIQSTVESVLPTLSPSLARVAALLRENPKAVLESSINELADQCGTSVASIVRFCRAIGFTGYTQLRMAMATELGRESVQFADTPAYGAEIADGDSLRSMASKIAALETLAIEETVADLDYEQLEAIVSALDGASRILLFGMGASQFVAQDLGHKLLRIGRMAFVFTDAHEASASASLDFPGTVAIGFSHLGYTTETLQFLAVAKSAGATTIGVTSGQDSKLAQQADHFLLTRVRETSFRAGAMVSRIAQLAVVDCIFLGVAQRRYADTVDALRRTREATRQARGI